MSFIDYAPTTQLALALSISLALYLAVNKARQIIRKAAKKSLENMARKEGQKLKENPRTFTKEQLAEYDGSDPSRPLLLALKGAVVDVSNGKDFYGPMGPYAIMAGKDAR